jgi:hypothetical protein
MHHPGGCRENPAGVARGEVRESELPARIGQGDLAVVHVAGEHELEAAGLEQVEDARVVAEEDA